MRCIICHGEDIRLTAVRRSWLENNIVYVPIHTPVCRTCGERYYDRRTIRFLEEVKRKLGRKKLLCKEVGKVLVYGDA